MSEKEKPKVVKKVWLQNAKGEEVDIFCFRSPKVHGKVVGVDLRFGKVLIENEEEMIEVAMSDISQVRYPKA